MPWDWKSKSTSVKIVTQLRFEPGTSWIIYGITVTLTSSTVSGGRTASRATPVKWNYTNWTEEREESIYQYNEPDIHIQGRDENHSPSLCLKLVTTIVSQDLFI